MAKVLIVDDEKDICEITSFLFESNGHETAVAYDTQEGLGKVESFAPDLVISDIRMPGGGGIHLLEEIQKMEEGKPVVFLITGYADITKEDALKKGAADIFSKPIKLQEIYSRVMSVTNLASTSR